MGVWLAALSGLIGGGALFVGAGVAWFVKAPRLVVLVPARQTTHGAKGRRAVALTGR